MLHWLDTHTPFPEVTADLGLNGEAPGLVAVSEKLTVDQLLRAYPKGFFPWYSPGQPVLWWNPDPRMVLYTSRFKVSTSLRKVLRNVLRDAAWEIKVDVHFRDVVQACAYTPRHSGTKAGLDQTVLRIMEQIQRSDGTQSADGTWITPEIQAVYGELHALGYAHSVETWYEGRRVGGLYGAHLGRVFFGESMFAWQTNASKIALAALVGHLTQEGVALLDCQQRTTHLASLGGEEIPRADFLAHLAHAVHQPPIAWTFGKEALTPFV